MEVRTTHSNYRIRGDGEVEYRGLTSWNRLELRMYRLMGIFHFRKALLKLEARRHHKDHLKNENYHPAGFDFISLEQHNGYLLYNTLLHCGGLLVLGIYLILTVTWGIPYVATHLLAAILVLINAYCILLQRATYLKLKETRYLSYQRFLRKNAPPDKQAVQKLRQLDQKQLQHAHKVLCQIWGAVNGQATCVLAADDLKNLAQILELAGFSPRKRRSLRPAISGVSEGGLLENCRAVSRPFTPSQVRVDWLQRRFHLPGRKLLDHAVIVTESRESEKLYRKLVPDDTASALCGLCWYLYALLTQALEEETTYETHSHPSNDSNQLSLKAATGYPAVK